MTESWRLLPYHRGPADLHVALSDALVRHGTVPSVWWHATSVPALVLGPSQRQLQCGLTDPTVTRRTSGGTAVYASTDFLGLDVFLPSDHRLVTSDVVENYHWVGTVWLAALRSLGIDARLVSIREARDDRRSSHAAQGLESACFGSLSPYEVASGTRKLVGLAQVLRRNGTLLQAGVHRRFDAASLAKLLTSDDWMGVAQRLEERAAGLDDVSPRQLADSEIFGAFADALNRLQACELVPGAWSPEELRQLGSLVESTG